MRVQIERVSIESLCLAVTSGGTPSRTNSRFWEDGSIPWYKTSELKDWYVDDAEERITEEGLSGSSAKMFPPETVLMAMYGDGKTITSLGILRNEAATNQACCAMMADPAKCNFLYLFYALKYHRHELLKLVVAGAQRNLSGGIIRKFRITSHPLPVQTRIADILSPYDDLIANNRRRMALLEEAARQLYREWFIHLRFPGHEHTCIRNGQPDGWEKVKVGSLMLKVSRAKKIKKEDYAIEGTIPCVDQGSNFIGGYTDDPDALIEQPLPLIVFGDHTRVLKFVTFPFACGADGTQLIYPNTPRVSPEYLYLALKAVELSNYFYARHFKFLKEQEVIIPSTSFVQEFTYTVAPCFEQIKILRTQNKKLRTARDLLLPRLMSGEIPV